MNSIFQFNSDLETIFEEDETLELDDELNENDDVSF